MNKRLSILWLTLPLLLTSCSKDVWHTNINDIDFTTLDTILYMVLLAGTVIALGQLLLRYYIIPYFESTRSRSHHLWHWVENHLTDLFYTAWGFGFITYFVGSFVGDTFWAGVMSMLSSAPM